MIYCLTGKIIKKTLDSVVISCGGGGPFFPIPPPPREALPPPRPEGAGYTIITGPPDDVPAPRLSPAEPRGRL